MTLPTVKVTDDIIETIKTVNAILKDIAPQDIIYVNEYRYCFMFWSQAFHMATLTTFLFQNIILINFQQDSFKNAFFFMKFEEYLSSHSRCGCW